MIDSVINYNIQSLNQTYEEIGDQFNEVHHNLTYNIEKFNRKKKQINSFSTQKINACLQMIKREKQLTEYANNLILKQQSLKSKKKYYSKKSDAEIQIIDEETEKANNRLQLIFKEKRRLIKRKQELQIEHKKISEIIIKASSALELLKNNEIETETLADYNNVLSTMETNNETTIKKIERKKEKIEQAKDSIIFLNTSIMKLKIALQDTQIDHQSVKSKILAVQARFNKIKNEINEFKEEMQKKQSDILNKASNLKQVEANLVDFKSTIQIHCDSIKQKLCAYDLAITETRQSINTKTIDISLKNDKIKELNVGEINFEEQKEMVLKKAFDKTAELKKSENQVNLLNQEIISILHQKKEIKISLNKENIDLSQIQCDMQASIPLINELTQYFNKIDDALITEEALDKLYKEINDKKNQKMPDFNQFQEIKDKKFQMQQIIKSLSNDIVLETDCTNQLNQITQEQEKKNLNYKNMSIELAEKISQVKNINDPLLLSLNSQPTIENVTNLIQTLQMKRSKRLERKARDNETLQKRYNELVKRINIRKRKMKRQVDSIEKEKDEYDILPDEEKLVFKSIDSLYLIVNDEVLLWKKEKFHEDDTLLCSYEKQMEDLYDKLDEFFIRK
ncbi:hypothetical protein M9Y10_044830 [Tritrichomonas musculus]|uniref:Uncharacterized protein n=1 Tax=Tritrichomonas musculus TaxID=1915356 RepID=A0ABR2JTR7_9EUKA